MEYRTLGRSGCAVSALALGTMTFGTETAEAGSHAQLDRFVEAGGTFVDTADVYTRGAAEEIVGRWLAKRPERRDSIVLATKGRFPTGAGPNDLGLSRRHLSAALDDSLRRLGVDSVDLYQVHAWDPLTRWRRRCASSTTRCGGGRSGTPGCPTTPAGRCRRRWTSPTTGAGPHR